MPRYRRKMKRKFPARKRHSRFRSRFSRKRHNRIGTSMKVKGLIAPDTTYVKLRTNETFVQVAGIAANATLTTNFTNGRLIRGGDIYDPTSNKGTVQPTGFGQWLNTSGLYNAFVVHASKIVVTICNLDSTSSLDCALYPITESNAVTVSIRGDEQPYCRNALVGTSSGNSKVVMKNFMKTKKMFGVDDIMDDPGLRGSFGGSPTVNWDWALDVNVAGTITTGFVVKRTVTYYCQLLSRPVVSTSTGT